MFNENVSFQPPRRLIEEIDSVESIPSKDPYGVGNPANIPSTSKPFIPREVLKKLRAEQSTQSGQDPRLGPNSKKKSFYDNLTSFLC